VAEADMILARSSTDVPSVQDVVTMIHQIHVVSSANFIAYAFRIQRVRAER